MAIFYIIVLSPKLAHNYTNGSIRRCAQRASTFAGLVVHSYMYIIKKKNSQHTAIWLSCLEHQLVNPKVAGPNPALINLSLFNPNNKIKLVNFLCSSKFI